MLADSRNSPGILLLPPGDIYPSRWTEFDRERVDQMILRVSPGLKISLLREGKSYWRSRTQFSVRNSELISWYQTGKKCQLQAGGKEWTLFTVTTNQESSIPLRENKNWDLLLLFIYFILRQGLTMGPRQVWNSRLPCPSLPSARTQACAVIPGHSFILKGLVSTHETCPQTQA